jgi:hypothetical protein
MPTAAKLVAALLLGALGLVASEVIKTILPASTDFGMFSLVNTAIGFVCGWIIVGNRAGRGFSAAISNGFTGMVALVFWGLFVQAANEMTRLAMRHRYDGPVEALADVFQIMVDYGAQMLNAQLLLLLLLGSIGVGLLSEIASRHWR